MSVCDYCRFPFNRPAVCEKWVQAVRSELETNKIEHFML